MLEKLRFRHARVPHETNVDIPADSDAIAQLPSYTAAEKEKKRFFDISMTVYFGCN